jgi:hypothetical protein
VDGAPGVLEVGHSGRTEGRRPAFERHPLTGPNPALIL